VLDQIRTVDRERLLRRIGSIPERKLAGPREMFES
jgi:hypothetical protein